MLISVLSAGLLGASVKRRIELLSKLLMMIKSIRAYISFSKLPLTRIMKELEADREFSCLGFLNELNLSLDTGEDFYTAFEESLLSFYKDSALKDEDIRLVLSFAGALGSSDVNGQLQNCDTYSELLSARIDRLNENAENKIRVYNSLGFLAATLVAVLIL